MDWFLSDRKSRHRARRSSQAQAEPAVVRCSPERSWAAEGLSAPEAARSEEHTSELQSLMRISYAVFCLKKNKEEFANSPALVCTPDQKHNTSTAHTTNHTQN